MSNTQTALIIDPFLIALSFLLGCMRLLAFSRQVVPAPDGSRVLHGVETLAVDNRDAATGQDLHGCIKIIKSEDKHCVLAALLNKDIQVLPRSRP
ncbi:MAG: hypothetical protein ACLFVT_06865 [Syntrophobacteria bacterium]